MNGDSTIMSINTGIINYQLIKSSVEATLPFSKSVSIKFTSHSFDKKMFYYAQPRYNQGRSVCPSLNEG